MSRLPFGRRGKRELSGRKRLLLMALSWVQIALLIAALRDIRRRPADQIRGPKLAWALASFVNFIGPISYFLFGRRR